MKVKLNEIEARASEAENLLYEARCHQEDIRKARAELKLQLGKSQTEVQVVKENLSKTTSRSQEKVDEMNAAIERLQQQYDEAQRKLRRFSSVYHDIIDVFDRAETESFTKPQGYSRSRDDFDLLDQIVPFISSTLNESAEKAADVDVLQKDIWRLQGDFKRATDLGTQYQKQLEEEKTQNEKLFELLQQAEIEMERSANQIREMPFALTKLQQQESDMLARTKAAEDETHSVRDELRRAQNELCNERKNSQHKGNEFSEQLTAKQKLEEELRSTIEALEAKTGKLRQYVNKLTTKCEEWEKSYERQGKSVEKLQAKNTRLREKAIEMAAKYKQLSGHVKSKSKVSSLVRSKHDII